LEFFFAAPFFPPLPPVFFSLLLLLLLLFSFSFCLSFSFFSFSFSFFILFLLRPCPYPYPCHPRRRPTSSFTFCTRWVLSVIAVSPRHHPAGCGGGGRVDVAKHSHPVFWRDCCHCLSFGLGLWIGFGLGLGCCYCGFGVGVGVGGGGSDNCFVRAPLLLIVRIGFERIEHIYSQG